MSEPTPAVSVILPVYNGEGFIAEAVDSILRQTFSDLELIVVDDGSDDGTTSVLASFEDPRLRVHTLPENQGIVTALNRGFELARGELIARQDADDRSYPLRLEAQVAAFRLDPELIVLGTACDVVDSEGRFLHTHRLPLEDSVLRWRMLFQNSFVHSSVMFRRRAVDDLAILYDPEHRHAEDYDLWCRLLHHGKGANLPEPLLALRRHPGQVSVTAAEAQRAAADAISRRQLTLLGLSPSQTELRVLRDWQVHWPRPLRREEMTSFAASGKILAAFERHTDLPKETARDLRRRWVEHTLSHAPFHQLPDLWRSGLLAALGRQSPGGLILSALRETWRRARRRPA